MKNLRLLSLAVALFIGFLSQVQAQSKTNIPNDGVVVRLDNYNLEVKAGETSTGELKLVRSKYYQKRQTPITLKVNAPEGIVVTFATNPTTGDAGKFEIKTDKTVKAGKYNIYFQNADAQLKVSGAIFTLTVNETATVKE